MSAAKRAKLDDDGNCHFYPVLPDELIEDIPLEEVYYTTVANPKDISKAITELNAVYPLPELMHLKKMRGKEILLLPCAVADEDQVLKVLKSKGFNVALLEDNIRRTMVAKIAPKVRKQYEVVNKLWPCNFHCNKYLEKLSTNTMFNEREMQQHRSFMKVAVDVAKMSSSSAGVVVVDPKLNSLVAVGYSQTSTGPYKHAVMVAVDNVAKTQNGGLWQNPRHKTNGPLDLRGIPDNLLNRLQEKHPNISFGATKYKSKCEVEVPADGPYLCTGYYLYSTCEPCVMCAMALIHSRIKRVIYGSQSTNGGLGTLCKIHTVKDLNHHYEVFAGLLERECQSL